MEAAAVGLGGCLAGLGFSELLRRRSGAKTARAPQDSGFATGAMSPGAVMSPPTHLRRDPWASPGGLNAAPVSGEAVTENASLTRNFANLNMLPGVVRNFDKTAYVELLRKLIDEVRHLQNNPRLGVHPQEKKAAQVCMAELQPYSTAAGGPLVVEELEYVPGRSNLKIVYPGTGPGTVAFVGSHLDVVPADPETWDRDPFSLVEEDDRLYARGTTDCLGHVAMLTRFMCQLAQARPRLKRTIVVLFICAEEGGEMNVGVDKVVAHGKMDEVKGGPVYWVDCADSEPCCGTSGMLSWSLKCRGRLFHSGIPHKGINSIELASEAVNIIQQRFYDDFPPHVNEKGYRFATGSHMKPTQIECAKGSTNQICPETTVSGDIRLSPFYEVKDVVERVEEYVKDLNDEIEELPTRGPWSKFVLPVDCQVMPSELKRGKIELKWLGTMESFMLYQGIAVRLDSEGHKALLQAFRETNAAVKPFSISGSLPLVRMMQKQGFDIQLCGFGHMSVYHGVNEYCSISAMEKGHEVIARTICLLEEGSA